MMNPTEIADALDEIARAPFDAAEFGFSFAEATDNARATISKLRSTTNKSDIQGGVLLNRKFHYAPAPMGKVSETLDVLRASKKTSTAKPAIVIATDGQTVSAEHPKSGETRHFLFSELGLHFGFLLPAAGKDRYKPAEENPVDVKAAGKLAKLYDTLMRVNPAWATDERRHDMNLFMTRIIFCLFSEDVGIFKENQFSHAVFTYGGNKGESAQETIISAFSAMNLPKDQRQTLPSWTAEFEYVNGGLFAGRIDAPQFDQLAFRYLRDACDMDWKLINPDIFGSMIQSIADSNARSELGMHYTSVPNIMKVLGPLFLDELDEAIEKASGKLPALRSLLKRLSHIKVFDPACGSGNFLVVAYRQLREREILILQKIEQLTGNKQNEFWSSIPLSNFYGIEITDFAAETAKLALFIAEYQANARFKDVFGLMPALLPLRDGGNIWHDNALRINWDEVCPPPQEGEEVYIAGNPPFMGFNNRNQSQQSDMDFVLKGRLNTYHRLDYVICWFVKLADYIKERGQAGALVATSSICQGATVPLLWNELIRNGIEINFAYQPFYWSNNATDNAAVSCVIVGLKHNGTGKKRLFSDEIEHDASNINGYLLSGPNLIVTGSTKPIFDLPKMDIGNIPRDDGHLILSEDEKNRLVDQFPNAIKYIKKFLGSKEVVRGLERYCLWIPLSDLEKAREIPTIHERLLKVQLVRENSDAAVTRDAASTPHRFGQITGKGYSQNHAILVPRVTSARRPYLAVDKFGSDVISSDLNQVLYDAPDWCIALIASRLHLVWIATVCGKLKADYRYSSTMGWNTFPIPKLSPDQLEQLTASARLILKTRYAHHPKTIADLYDPDKMPDDLRAVHKANDDLLESMYIGRPFRNDTERLEKLFKLYASRVDKKNKGA